MMKATIDENCIGCGLCESLCPDVFKMADDGLAKVIADPVPDADKKCAVDAEDQCPVDAIHLEP